MELILMQSGQEEELIGLSNLSVDECLEQIDRSLSSIRLVAFEEPQQLQPRKKKKFILNDLTPLNCQEQRRLFFERKCQMNPMFEYRRDLPEKEYQLDRSLLDKALAILEDHRMELEERKEETTKKRLLTVEETIDRFTAYLRGVGLEGLVELEFEQGCISRTRVKFTASRTVIVIRKPVQYTEETIEGVMNHEIGTHILRRENDERQIFHGNRAEFGLAKQSKQIEEGLAVIAQMINVPKPRLFLPALRYYSSVVASEGSFVELFAKLSVYLPDQHECWRECLRVKRGTIDTSIPKGFYKDQMYFKGAYQLLRRRNTIDFAKMFQGKVNIEDLSLVKIVEAITPPFLDEHFYDKLELMARVNHIK